MTSSVSSFSPDTNIQKIRIADAFVPRTDNPRGKAFIPFITAGDPDLETTARIVRAIVDAGADLIELGIPFSDPTAEGPVIQEANIRALGRREDGTAAVTTDDVFDMVEGLRYGLDGGVRVGVPMVFMTYANVLYSYGLARFARRAAEIGIQGVILPDVPYEEKLEFSSVLNTYGLELVSLIAPTSHERIRMIAAAAQGFVYMVSSLGVTGVRSEITTNIGAMTALVREAGSVPCAVGFGISTPAQAARMADLSDGAIVGSAIVKIIAEYGRDAVEPVADYVRKMVAAVHAI